MCNSRHSISSTHSLLPCPTAIYYFLVCTYTAVYKCWPDRHVVSCASLYYQVPIAIHFLNFKMVLHCEDDIYSYDIALCINKTFIMIPSKPRLTTGTQKISQNCRIIKTWEQAFQYSTFRHPIRILLRWFIFSALKKVRKSQQNIHAFGRACDWGLQSIHPDPAVLQYWVTLLCLMRKDFVVSSRCSSLIND